MIPVLFLDTGEGQTSLLQHDCTHLYNSGIPTQTIWLKGAWQVSLKRTWNMIGGDGEGRNFNGWI